MFLFAALNQQAASAEGNMSASATQLAVQQGKFQLSSAKEVLKVSKCVLWFYLVYVSFRSRMSQTRVPQLLNLGKNLLFGKISAENYIKMKEIRPGGAGGVRP